MVYKFFDEKFATHANKFAATLTGTGTNLEAGFDNQKLTKQLHKLIIKKSNKCKVCSFFKDNICGDDLADMQLIIKYH